MSTVEKKSETASLNRVQRGEDDGFTKVESEDVKPVTPPDASSLTEIEILILLDLWSDSGAVVEGALKQLADKCSDDYQAREDICRRGIHTSIVGAMKKWYGLPAVQAEGCRVLQQIGGFFDTEGSKAPVEFLVEAIIWALKTYPNNSRVQGHGCGALGVFCTRTHAFGAEVVDKFHGLGIVLAAMRKFPDDVVVQGQAALVLWNFSNRKETKACMTEAGAGVRRALLEAIENHNDDNKEHVKDLQHYARRALKSLLER